MEYLFEEFKKIDKQTLFIIGNGFDIAHNIKSKYMDFKRWCELNGHKSLVDLMTIFFSNYEEVWSNIESALGHYDEDAIIDYCKPNSQFDYDHPTRSISEVEDSPEQIFKPVLEDFKDSFDDWVNSIDITSIKPLTKFFPHECKYITFNYTETLEKVYGVPQNNILHVHGSRLSDKKYIIGHNNLINPNVVYDDESDLFYIQDTKKKIIEWMNEFVKHSDQIISRESNFFSSLKNINHVIVFGHSLNEIDYSYLREVINQTGKDILWTIYYHSKKDLVNIDKFVDTMHLTKVKRISN